MLEKQLIDAKPLMENGWHLVKTGESNRFLAQMSLADVPTVEAVEVVRCKDCDWYRKHEGGICVNPKCGKSWYGCPVPAEHFCSYGERREGE